MGAELGTALSTAGALGSSGIDAYMGRENAKDSMHFSKSMSSTAHWREVQDLIRAGLNPVLSAKFGGSSTPSAPTIPSTDFASSAQHLNQLSLQKQQLAKQLENVAADTDAKEAQADLADAQTAGFDIDNEKKRFELSNLANQAEIVKENLNLLRSNARSAGLDVESQEGKLSPYRKFGEVGGFSLYDLEKAIETGDDAMSIINPGRFFRDFTESYKQKGGDKPLKNPDSRSKNPADGSRKPPARKHWSR